MRMGSEFKIAVCDDEKFYRKYINQLIMDYFLSKDLMVHIDLFSDGSEFCSDKNNFYKYDIIFLDIVMNQMNGIDTAYTIRRFNAEMQIVFITVKIEYSLEGYKVNAMRFIIKDDLEHSLQECLEALVQSKRERMVSMKFGFIGGERNVILEDILYIENQSHKLRFVGKAEELYLNKKLNEVEERLRPYHFARAHQSYLVNLDYVDKLASYKVYLFDGSVLPAAKGRYAELRERYLWYKESVLF